MDAQRLQQLLQAAHSPGLPPAERSAAEAELQALGRSLQALEWALSAWQSPPQDPASLFFACAVVAAAAHYRWARLDSAQQAVVRAALWRGVTDPAAPHFQRAKLGATLAHVACLDGPEAWPEFLAHLQACLAEPARRGPGVDLLTTTVDHFHSLAQTTSVGLKGKVPSAAIPAIQQRYRELQPLALATLCSLLHQLRGGLPTALQAGDGSSAALACKALRGLRATLADSGRLPEEIGSSYATIMDLLFSFVAAARAAPPGSPADEAAVQAASAALDCAADLCSKFYGPEENRRMLDILVPQLRETCALVQLRWAQQGNAFQLEDPLLTSAVRLLIQCFTTQLSNIDASPHLAPQLHAVLAQVLVLSTQRRSPADLLLFLEVWHPVISYISSTEDEAAWDTGCDPEAQQRMQAAVAAYTGPILAAAELVLSTLSLGGPAAPPPPFTADALSGAPGSGSAMDEWVTAVVAGGDAGKEGEGEQDAASPSAAAAEEDADADELLVPGTAQGSRPFTADAESEYEVYVRHAETFLGQVLGTFSAATVLRVLQRLQACSGAFAAACERAGAGAQQAGQLPAFRAMDVCLRLLVRCGPLLPTRGAAGEAAPLDGSTAISGAHAVQCLRGLFQLADCWLRAVQAMAAAAAAQQAAAQPATLANTPAGSEAMRAMVAAGRRVYKAIGSLTATWVSQVFMGVRGADPEAEAIARELVGGVVCAGAALLRALTSPQLDGGWRVLLHQAAVWAAESLVSLSSIALSCSIRPQAALLDALWQSEQAQVLVLTFQAALANPALLPLRACRALGLCLSDLSLRSWPSHPPAQFDGKARGAAFASLASPLVHCLQAGAAAAAGGQASAPEAAAAVRQAAAAATSVVQSYAGSNKVMRRVVGAALVSPALPSTVELLRAAGSRGAAHSKAAAALLRLISASLISLPTELSTETVGQLLGAVVQAFSASGGDPTFESDLLVVSMLTLVLSQGGSQKHRALALPALDYMVSLWERASSPQAAAADVDTAHVRAMALAGALQVLRYKWQALMGGGTKPAAPLTPSDRKRASSGTHATVAEAAAAAAAGSQPAEGEGPGAAAVAQVLQLLLHFFGAAGSLQAVLAAADVRAVLEELYELQVATRLFSLPLFQPLRAPLAEALLGALASRLYGAAQDDLSDSLFLLAASNWSEFHLSVLPRVIEQRLPGAGPSERAALVGLFGAADLDAHSFEHKLRLFLNDYAFLECAAA